MRDNIIWVVRNLHTFKCYNGAEHKGLHCPPFLHRSSLDLVRGNRQQHDHNSSEWDTVAKHSRYQEKGQSSKDPPGMVAF